MKYTELNSKGAQELKDMLKDTKKSIFDIKLRLKTMQTQGTHELRAAKKDIARILTALRAK